ncbi:TetR/AcrR family transcriptional regulator [Vibrio aestuarianus]|uniref:TetR/AcrR family transcriptional regulator n=1 Tax=Vibrio aestuarianus TaxID=28171 RepID=UPI001558F7A2|nr:TetR family transcriptional regulator [Vibrio aestuarianus]MDE1327719.1 TetR family transcriptional regulator [Vibrio aestuarianus]NGZ65967.1 TetR/AcrR family transcriptional regulator [Vibrio aestuarianus subsp. cardii]
MADTPRKVGRPNEKTQTREALIQHARELFVVMPYDKVSTRLVAQKAEVNVAMIRYYFGSKAGLFETMLRETLMPMQQKMRTLVAKSSHKNLAELMRTFFHQMIKVPQFPRLVSQVMHMSPSDTQRKLMEKVFLDVAKPMLDVIFEKLMQQGVIRPNVDPQLCRMSLISLMVFPFIAPPALLAMHGIELTDDFINRLYEHNILLMTQGFILPTPSKD